MRGEIVPPSKLIVKTNCPPQGGGLLLGGGSYQGGEIIYPTRHILPPSEIDLGLFLAVLQAQEGTIYFTELAERVEYGNYVYGSFHRRTAGHRSTQKDCFEELPDHPLHYYYY